jgi:uncharacterized protein YecE (DUF72 family)
MEAPRGVIRIGTCSWAKRCLIESGAFYPPTVSSSERRLRFYASHFDTVEVDSSYYAIPATGMAEAWAARTPEKFLFHVKAYGALTGHPVAPKALPDEWRGVLRQSDLSNELLQVSDPAQLRTMAQAFATALAPLKAVRKLGFVIFQFPPWFTCKNANRDYLVYCRELMAGLPLAVEFRHGSWLTHRHAAETISFLREQKITYITCDEPQYGDLSSAPFHPEATTSMAYLRLHGRSPEWRGCLRSSNDYCYGTEELEDIAAVVRRLSLRTRAAFVMFNNCHGGHAAVNGLAMKAMLHKG